MEDAQPTAAVDKPSLPCSGDLAPVSDDYAAAATDAGESKPEGGAVDAVQVNGSVIAAETMIYQTQGSAVENGSVAGYPLEQQYEEAYSLEEERLWNLVGENSLDFDAWTALIDETEKVSQLNIVDGKMQYLFDEDGRRYLDAFAGIATVCCGHCHPEVVEAIINQTKRLQHSTVLYLNHAVTDFAEALASKLPGDLKVVFFTNSGTEANELAMMISRLYTGSHDIISLRNAYHGNASGTMGATAQSNWKFNVIQSGVHHAVNPDPYRGLFGSDGEKYARDVQEIIDFGTSGGVAAFFSESIQGVGGIVELAPGYLPAAYEITRKAGGLCIADEVQTGFARTGSHFWGFESHGVVPDIVTMAKGIGNGIPIGAVVTTPEIAQVLTRRSYFNTFGANPVCTAGGHAVLRVLEKEKLQQNAFVVGSYLKDRLRNLQEKHEIIGDVRGRGLMLGVELVTDHKLKTPAKAEILEAMDQMKDMGVLVGKGGFYGNVFRITPPLCFTKEDSDFLVDVMDIALSKL